MIAEALLDCLSKVKKTGSGSWLACCPAHNDKTPSLAVSEKEDRVLVHCFSGCSVEEILDSVGLPWESLFPLRDLDLGKPFRRAFPAADVLEALSIEAIVVATAASWLAQGCPLSEAEKARLLLAAERIQEGRGLANG